MCTYLKLTRVWKQYACGLTLFVQAKPISNFHLNAKICYCSKSFFISFLQVGNIFGISKFNACMSFVRSISLCSWPIKFAFKWQLKKVWHRNKLFELLILDSPRHSAIRNESTCYRQNSVQPTAKLHSTLNN